ncbi:MAG: aminotransferase class I/II-fold pyridoxal phosphate-dependent enzyme, partial [Chitinophagales bacterium]
PSQFALAKFMQKGGNSLDFKDDYEQKRNYFSKAIAEIGFKPLSCAGSYFLLADYSALSEKGDIEFCEWLTKDIGVSAVPTSVLYHPHFDQKLIRFCFAKKQETLGKAIEKLWKISE